MSFGGPTDPSGWQPFGQPPQGVPPVISASAPPPPLDETNTLATLSMFAFIFAPAGAVLSHLALSEIKKRPQNSRSRAIVGLTLSYVVIFVAARRPSPVRCGGGLVPHRAPPCSSSRTSSRCPDVASAQSLFDEFSGIWERCEGKTVNESVSDPKLNSTRTVNEVRATPDTLMAFIDNEHNLDRTVDSYKRVRAIGLHRNYLVDLEIRGWRDKETEQTVDDRTTAVLDASVDKIG